MRKLWAATAAVVVCLALSGLSAVAQEKSPGGVSGEVFEPVAVTGTEACTITKMGVRTFGDGVERLRDHLLDCLDTMSDPRVSGHYTNYFNYDCYGGDDCIFWALMSLTGPMGAGTAHTPARRTRRPRTSTSCCWSVRAPEPTTA